MHVSSCGRVYTRPHWGGRLGAEYILFGGYREYSNIGIHFNNKLSVILTMAYRRARLRDRITRDVIVQIGGKLYSVGQNCVNRHISFITVKSRPI